MFPTKDDSNAFFGSKNLINPSINGKFKFVALLILLPSVPSASYNQNCSTAFSGWSCLLPTITEAFSPPIDVPAIILNFILLLAHQSKKGLMKSDVIIIIINWIEFIQRTICTLLNLKSS